MKKYSIVLLLSLFCCTVNAIDQVPSIETKEETITKTTEKTFGIRQEINAFVARPDIQERLNMKSSYVRSMLNTIDKSMVIAEKSSAWDQAASYLFYNFFPGGILEFESKNGLSLLKEEDAPLLHACLQELCLKNGQPEPLIFLNSDKDYL